MNQTILLTLLLFFVLQGLIYISCIVKLAEIRRQKVPPRTKLKLLENEDHLFDAGLYLGFVGTIISLILVSMHIIEFSLMAAYSSHFIRDRVCLRIQNIPSPPGPPETFCSKLK